MARSEEAQAWAEAVYAAVQEIPHGRITTYGHIAHLLGEPQRARQVGTSLKVLPAPESGLHFNSESVPWHRVISQTGIIPDRGPGSVERHAEALEREGVEIRTSMGQKRLGDWRRRWFPSRLPSEEGDQQ